MLVAKVTLNRVKSDAYPGSICAVVYQPYQFSWTMKPRKEPNPHHWQIAAKNAYKAFKYKSAVTHFHNMTVQPEWSYSKQFVIAEGNHVFYK